MRSAGVTLFLFSVAEPDYMAVRARVVEGDALLYDWELTAENGAGGYYASPGKGQRVKMLVNVIARKLETQLRSVEI